jgi:hypothetical protein
MSLPQCKSKLIKILTLPYFRNIFKISLENSVGRSCLSCTRDPHRTENLTTKGVCMFEKIHYIFP